MTILNQRDSRWASIPVGTGRATIGQVGCTITCVAMIVGTTPDIVNDRLKAVSGFANDNLVIWTKIEEAFPGIKVNRVWSYNNDDVLAHVPNVIVQVDGTPIGGSTHFVVYIGNHQINDPWDGQVKPTSTYAPTQGYATFTGTWTAPVKDNYYEGYDLTNKDSMKVAVDVVVRLQKGELIDKTTVDALNGKIQELNTTIGNQQKDLDDRQAAINTLNLKIQTLTQAQAQDAIEDHDQGVKLTDTEHQRDDALKLLQSHYGQLKAIDEATYQTAIKALQTPHSEVVKQVQPTLDALAEAAIVKNPKAKQKASIIRSFLNWLNN